MWPAEWRVFRYVPGLPIEQTRRRVWEAIVGIESVERAEDRSVIFATALLSSSLTEDGESRLRRRVFCGFCPRLEAE